MLERFGSHLLRVGAVCAALAPSAALARSAALPGVTVGLPVGWQIPPGVYLNVTSSFGMRETLPRDNQGNNNLLVINWSTPWTVLGGQLRLIQSLPINAVSQQANAWQSGIAQPLSTAQIAWKIGDGLGVSYFLGGFWPTDTRFSVQAPSIAQRFAISYVGDGLNLTANLHYGTMLQHFSPVGTLPPSTVPTRFFFSDYMNLDLTATKRFGKWQLGPVAFGSTDLPVQGRPSFRPLGQIAVGALVGYAFDPVTVQAFVTRDVIQRNYGGEETRFWLRLLTPLYREEAPKGGTTLVRRNSAAE